MKPTTLLENTIAIFKVARQSVIQGMIYLAEVKKQGVWEGEYSSWGEFVESALGISQGQASKMLTTHKAWIEKAGIGQTELEGTDLERLYLGVPMLKEASAQEVLARVKTLTRSELRQTNSENEPHTPDFHRVCTICWVSEENHG